MAADMIAKKKHPQTVVLSVSQVRPLIWNFRQIIWSIDNVCWTPFIWSTDYICINKLRNWTIRRAGPPHLVSDPEDRSSTSHHRCLTREHLRHCGWSGNPPRERSRHRHRSSTALQSSRPPLAATRCSSEVQHCHWLPKEARMLVQPTPKRKINFESYIM